MICEQFTKWEIQLIIVYATASEVYQCFCLLGDSQGLLPRSIYNQGRQSICTSVNHYIPTEGYENIFWW